MPQELRESEESFVWVRDPSTNEGPYRHAAIFRSGILYVDLFAPSWAEIDELEDKIAFLDGHTVLSHGDARNIRYEKGAALPVPADSGPHRSIAHTITFIDTRSLA